MILYHYTSKIGYDSIGNTNILMPSTDRVMDSTYGEGHYFTDLIPTSCERLIALRCWENKFMTFKVEYYLKLNIPDIAIKRCRTNVFLVSSGAIRNFNLIEKGPKPYCRLKPCDSCYLDPSI